MTSSMAEAFLQAIRERPEDDTSRLIYADWLDDNGDPARAELIRVQCEKAHLPRWHPRRDLLAWRERVLLAKHEHAWRAELPKIEGVERGAFERGFVHEVRVGSPEVLSARADQIRQVAPIRRAVVADVEGTWQKCAPLPFLLGLRIDDVDTMFEEPDTVFQSPLLSTLLTLDLSGCDMAGEQFSALGRSPHLANLRTLILDDCYMGDGNLRPFAEGNTFRNLTTLSMQGNQYAYHEDARIRPPDVALLADSPALARLTALNLAGNEIDTPGLLLLLRSRHLANLQELNVSRNRLTTDGFKKSLCKFDTGMRLLSLSLGENPIGGSAAALAGAAFCSELVDLDLNTCNFTSKGIRTLAGASWFARLGRLNLDHNSAGPDGIHALIRSLEGGELHSLSLRDNELDAEAVKLLVESKAVQHLTALDLSENPLDLVALEALARART